MDFNIFYEHELFHSVFHELSGLLCKQNYIRRKKTYATSQKTYLQILIIFT